MLRVQNRVGLRHGVAFAWTFTLGWLAGVSPAAPGNGGGNGNGGNQGNGHDPMTELNLIGLVHDFLPNHPDFDVVPPAGYGQCMWNIATTLDEDSKPVFVGGGARVVSQAEDSDGRPICWTLYDADAGDTPAVPGNPDNGSITSAQSFAEWYRDIPGTNQSLLVSVSGDIAEDGEFAGMFEINIPQFYPIDDILLGNDGEHNNFFTFEIAADFVYDAHANQTLYFLGDDDAWIFVENQLVGDLGGINGSTEQWVDMDRLNLTDGESYRIRMFMADRSDASSRFHLVTNIPMSPVIPSSILALFD